MLGIAMVVSGCTPEWTYLGEDQFVLNQSHANVLVSFTPWERKLRVWCMGSI